MDVIATIYDGGRVTIPLQFRQALGIQEGDKVTFYQENGELKISTVAQQLEQARAVFREHCNSDESAVDDFLAWRKKEFQSEEAEFNQLLKKDTKA
jgi:AbrB family looped-hinge helix DNA binding protein